MTRRLAAVTLAATVVAVGLLIVLGGPSSPSVAHATSPVPLTASYSTIGGSILGVQDLLTYVSGGIQQVVPLTGTPTVYMVDSGSSWSAQTTLNGSTFNERWITAQDVSGTISAPLTVSFSYYHQYLVTFIYKVTNGGNGYSGPPVSFNQMGAPVSSPAPDVHVWVDASSPYSFTSQLPGSTSSERWVLPSGGSGVVSGAATFNETYYHQYLVSSSFSIIGGGSPTAPALQSMAFGTSAQVYMTSFTQGTWFDAGAPYTFTSPITVTGSPANVTWIGTVLMQTQSGNVLSKNNNGTVTGPLSVTPVYYHQIYVSVKFTYVGGSTTGLTLPAFTYQYFGTKTSVNTNAQVWVDSGTPYTVPETICCTSSPSTERWELYNSTAGTISAPTTISSNYIHQYFDSFTFSIVGQQPSSGGQPVLTYLADGNAQQLALILTPQTFWADAGSAYSAASTLSASTASERWFAPSATGSIVGPAPNNSVDIAYTQQYLLTIVGGGLSTQWENAGNNTSINVPGTYGRSAGVGYRVVAYQIDSGSVVSVPQPVGQILVQLAMNGPHSISFQSVTQFQLTLDAGAAGGLYSITPPTIPGDNYWYDSASQVQVVLSGAWGRAAGVGHRISSISATAQATIQVDSVGTVQAYSTTALQSPVSITTTSTTQYEVVLNNAALVAFASISPPSTFTGDTYWYDAGSPAVTVVLDGIYSRSDGAGFRTTSWELGPGSVTKIAQTGVVTILTKAMTAPQFVNATSVEQYQVTLDKGGSSALSLETSPSVPLDSGWYDAGSPVGVVMNGAWARASGTGQRLAGYSLNGASEVDVSTTGLVNVLNLLAISSPEAITTSVVTQYQVSLDSGATSALNSMTPASIPQDKNWYDAGTQVAVSLNGVWGRTATTGTRLLSYSINLGASTSVLSSTPVQVLSVSGISAPESIATKTAAQYRVTSSPEEWASITNSTLPGDAAGWFDSGTAVKAVYSAVWNQTSTGSRQSVVSYSVDGLGNTNVARSGNGNFTIPLSMTQAHKIALTSVIQYLLAVVGYPQAAGSPPSPTGDNYFDAGSKVTLTVPRLWNGTSAPGTREVLTSYSFDALPPVNVPSSSTSASFTTTAVTFNQPHILVFNGLLEYQVAFQFFDGLGRSSVQPSDVQIGVGNATVDVQGQSVWLMNGTSFSVVSVTWEGSSVGTSPSQRYLVKAAPLNVTLDTAIYTASLKVVDLLGLPVSGAQVSMILANGTVITGATKGDGTFNAGLIPIGTFTAKVSDLGTSTLIAGNAAAGLPVAEGKLALSLVLLIVIVAVVAGGAAGGVLFLRLRKRGKKPTGPVS